ncbi:hypothetical protein AYL99_03957 [Fonsecaea erecta]|uniref:Major facilitator superfamily (MFS) profile domain-containing protein n=1 Tax=Fonsecaea erecta TaxID=1367422 RepID=A0A178ZPJ4_9EURO|nr:hypothetical protein AYL99_03957 [Fonsecaea erecta]OAP61754.1 hypothetical protein AYL99_03957 [Fonsecaea erecta]
MAGKIEADFTHGEVVSVNLKTANNVVLIPQPSDNPKDPLNWPVAKKIMILVIVSYTSFIGTAQQVANQSGIFAQATLYNRKPIELSYSISADVIGSVVGPLIWTAVARHIGRTSLMFWGTVVSFGCNIWSACMTKDDQYIAFVLSRWLAGLFASVSMTVGAGIILDIFFLHQRGKAFALYSVVTLFGALFAPVVSGFIVETTSWPVQFWWCVGGLGFACVLILFFMEDTTYDRSNSDEGAEPLKQSYVANRIDHLFPGNKVVTTTGKTSPWSVFIVAICPPILIAGMGLILTFSWVVGVNITLADFLQTPVELGGYGFTAQQNAEFTFAQWVSFLTAELYGFLLSDRAALWICRRHGGIWKPEYRLFPTILAPAIALPVGLIIFGVTLKYHLHYMVLALGLYLATFADMAIVPVLTNYLAECFTGYVVETYTCLWIFRLVLGVALPFFMTEWLARTGPAWTFGIMAIMSCVGGGLFLLLAWKGHEIREYSFKRHVFKRFIHTEEGVQVVRASLQGPQP